MKSISCSWVSVWVRLGRLPCPRTRAIPAAPSDLTACRDRGHLAVCPTALQSTICQSYRVANRVRMSQNRTRFLEVGSLSKTDPANCGIIESGYRSNSFLWRLEATGSRSSPACTPETVCQTNRSDLVYIEERHRCEDIHTLEH